MCWKEHLSSPAEEGVTVESVIVSIPGQHKALLYRYVWFQTALGGEQGRDYVRLILRERGLHLREGKRSARSHAAPM